MTYYNKENICDICKTNKLIPGNALREHNKNGDWTGRWLCKKCYDKYDPNSSHSIMKDRRDFRNNNLDPNVTTGKGYIFEQITVKVRGVSNLNIENDNFNSQLDHSKDPEYGVLQSKGAVYNPMYGSWKFHVQNDQEKEFDNLFAYCMSRDMKNVERVYIIPWEEVIKRKSISIIKNPSKGVQWYEKYRIDEKLYNDTYHNMSIDDCPVLRKK